MGEAGAQAEAASGAERRAPDHAAIGRSRLIAENVIDSQSIERAHSEKPVAVFRSARYPAKAISIAPNSMMEAPSRRPLTSSLRIKLPAMTVKIPLKRLMAMT